MSWNKVWTLLIGAAGIAGMQLWSKQFTLSFIMPWLKVDDVQMIAELIKLFGNVLIIVLTVYYLIQKNGSRSKSSDNRG